MNKSLPYIRHKFRKLILTSTIKLNNDNNKKNKKTQYIYINRDAKDSEQAQTCSILITKDATGAQLVEKCMKK